MTSEPLCPDQTTLQKIVLGQLQGAEAELWEAHLSTCPRCIDSLACLDKNDLLTEDLRRGQSGTAALPNETVQELIERLKQLLPGRPPEEAVPSVWPAASAADTETPEAFPFLAPPQQPGELGRLARYRMLRKLGQGGMGLVFHAEETTLQRSVALKVVLPQRIADAETRQRFLLEARTAAAIAHERIITIYEVAEDNGVPYLAMELLQGESLETRLRRAPGPYPVPFILRIGREIAEGLQAAHQLGFVHRDIKPSNLWLQTGGDHVKILDFGLARVIRTDTRLTHSGVILGTPGFLSPEQAAGRPTDARSDLFSLGVVLYLLATGELPFRGPDVLAILTALAVEPPRPVFELAPALPEPLGHLIMKLLSRQPGMRPKSAHEVIDVLAAVESRSPVDPLLGRARHAAPRRRLQWIVALAVGGMLVLGLLVLLSSMHAIDDGSQQVSLDPGPPAVLQHFAKLQFDKAVHCAAFSPDGKYILSGGDDRMVRLWDVATGTEVRKLAQLAGPVHSLAISGDGRSVVTGSGYFVTQGRTAVAKDCLVQVWNFADGKETARFTGHESPVVAVAISSDGRRVLSGAGRDHSRLWDVPAQRLLGRFGDTSNGSPAVAMSSHGSRGLIIVDGAWVCLLDLDKAEEVRRFRSVSISGFVRCVRFSPNSEHALSCSYYLHIGKESVSPLDCAVRLQELSTGTELLKLDGHGGRVSSCDFSPDGRYILSGGGTIALIGGQPKTFDCSVRLWDAHSGKELRRFEGHTAPVRWVAVSPDSRLGLSVGEDRTVRLWDLCPSTGHGLALGDAHERQKD